ncbi:hypothetical protein PHLGIDRAFT_28466 [Phlebiopsis gigantea 11061_1 CR5-6]|uniref:PH domain-containing protein n=1 Tax=Phlebiopsis gigantea (strain 11061_1 CR5-6) TaxID=745531 RepID=A0A0C3PSW3_PHLG1|nr:hypothetical protein PHLGIDRAFT_28466 [Phlebiopsis gigantea 11061_1 CR5-6]
MPSAASNRSVPPPSQQEVTRKLSKPFLTTGTLSGGESDSDSVFAADVVSPSPLSATAMHVTGGFTQPPLQPIAEGRVGSGEESEEDEEEDEGEWRVSTREQDLARGARDEIVLKTGYLWKKGERRKTWKKRWFVLRPAHLAFYKTSAEYKLLRLLDLSDVHSCTPVELKKHANTFCMISPTRTFYLQADKPHEVSEWVKAINEARTALLETSTQISTTTAPIPIPHSASQGRQSSYHPQAASPTVSHSHSPYNHHLTSSDSDDNAPSKPLSYSTGSANPQPSGSADPASPSRHLSPIDSLKIIHSGYLMKCGSRRHTWHNRWFVLSGDKLVYSRSHMDTKPHRSIPLAQLLDALEYDLPPHRYMPTTPAVSPPHMPHGADEHDGTAGKHTFKIVTTKRTLLLCAPSEEEEIKWLSVVRALIARRSVGAAGAAPGVAPASSPGAAASSSANSGTPAATASTVLPPPPASPSPAGSAPAPAGTHRRRDSFARRLSLSGGVGLLGSSGLHSNTAGGVPQEA